MENVHCPVMVKEVISALKIASEGVYVDCTVGEGGHSLAISGATDPKPTIVGIDLDKNALTTAKKMLGERAVLINDSYVKIKEISHRLNYRKIDGILLDLGLSSLQLETTNKGFSFARESRLDMRFDTKQELSAWEIVNKYSQQELADILYFYSNESKSRQLAKAIVNARPIDTTTELANLIKSTMFSNRKSKIHPATRTFQALRIATNDELGNIQKVLSNALDILKTGGRVVVITYHSIEDRLVKRFMTKYASKCICPPNNPICNCEHEPKIKLISKKVIKPSENELNKNPRSRSAKLRVAELL